MAKAAVKKMKKVDEDYRSLLMHHKEAKCVCHSSSGQGEDREAHSGNLMAETTSWLDEIKYRWFSS